MNGKVPHIVQYQGSKRILAPQILKYMPRHFNRLIEPFAGMAAISIAVAKSNMANSFLINDLNESLVNMLKEAVEHPQDLVDAYTSIWNEQFLYGEEHAQHFFDVRDKFNAGDESPANMLYLLARCVKGAVRYGKNGKFNQSPDKRRHGTNPKTIANNIHNVSQLLLGKTRFYSCDYREILELAKPGDLVYMDPPYQGVSNARDSRYFSGVSYEEFAEVMGWFDKKDIDYLISYDGKCGEKEYGEELPKSLNCKKVFLNAGLSSQALLLGEKSVTLETLYISKRLMGIFNDYPREISLWEYTS